MIGFGLVTDPKGNKHIDFATTGIFAQLNYKKDTLFCLFLLSLVAITSYSDSWLWQLDSL